MSISISLDTSADFKTLTSEGFSNILEPEINQFRVKNNRQYGYRVAKTYAMNSKVSGASASFNQEQQQYSIESMRNLSRYREDFYEEIDERISRNSLEYPEQQAKTVNEWLTSTTINPNSKTGYDDDELSHLGKVIGVRGFSNNETREQSDYKERAKFNRLKFDYLKLKSDHEKLRSSLDEILSKSKRMLKKKDYDIEVLKTLVAKQGRSLVAKESRKRLECNCNFQTKNDTLFAQEECAELEFKQLKHEFQGMQLRLDSESQEYERNLRTLEDENKKLKDQINMMQKDHEEKLDVLSNRMKDLTNEPSHKAISQIINENSKLKDLTEADLNEFLLLKENYLFLEDRLKSILEDQKCLDIEKNEEISKLMLELYRLQVYQPKLEMIVETERKIKVELQNKIDSLVEANKQQQDQLNDQLQRFNQEHLNLSKSECVEIDAMRKELSKWQDKYQKLLKDKSDSEELLQRLKFKLTNLDARHQTELDQVREASQCENNITALNLLKCEKERDNLRLNKDNIARKLEETETSKEQLENSVLKLRRELECLRAQQELAEKEKLMLESSKNRLVSFEDKLSKSESKINSLLEDQETYKLKLERSKRQIEELQQRIQHQQRAFDNLKESKDKELSRLRVNLNFEQYNRQVALKGIEKELRVSLRELESMKYRFSRRLAQSDPVHSQSEIEIEKTNRCRNNYNGSSTHTTESLSTTTTTTMGKQNLDETKNYLDRGLSDRATSVVAECNNLEEVSR